MKEDSNSQPSFYQTTRNDYSFLLKNVIVPVLQKEIQSTNTLGDNIREWHPSQNYNVLTFKRQIAPSDQNSLIQELISNKEYIIGRLNDSFFELKDLGETSFSLNVKHLELINGNLTLIIEMSWGN
ncbi:hypothetical protein [Enterococcus sp.]|uniref:hypothetical protein n=1 Tax=Enterococcus sp. TaxID=35783 RepID=UPI00290F016E|nr:hypothetical protein [Enterococcus sp.]MDU5337173.1 hypothetical protein [Enterococcus sp.]